MEEPVYVCKDNEMIRFPKNPSMQIYILKKAVWIIIAIMIVVSIIFHENLFFELSWTTRILFISVVAYVLYIGEDTRVPSPIEIRFYDDYMLVYRDKRYYDRKCSRQEYLKFYYKDIKRIEWRTGTKQVDIFGARDFKWYNYNKDGTLPDKLSYDRVVDSICVIYKPDDSTVIMLT